MYKVDPAMAVSTRQSALGPHPLLDLHPVRLSPFFLAHKILNAKTLQPRKRLYSCISLCSLLLFEQSKESIDAAIGDVLSKPWLPLPLGLIPPSLDSVIGELQRHGVAKIPPTCT